MYTYAILLYYLTGLAKPMYKVESGATREFPGAYNLDQKFDPDQSIAGLISMISFPSAGRLVNTSFILSFGLLLATLILSVFWLIPIVLSSIVLFAFGPVALVTTGWSVLMASSACVTLAVHLISYYWISVVGALVAEAIDRYGFESVKPHLDSIELHARTTFATSHAPAIRFANRDWVVSDLADANLDPAARFAVGSYWLYCPSRYERFSITGFSFAILALYTWKALYAYVRSTLRVVNWVFKAWLLLLIFCLCGSDRLVTTIAETCSWTIATILWPILSYLLHGEFSTAVRLCRVVALLAVVKTLASLHRLSVLTARKSATIKGLAEPTAKWRALWNNTIMDFTRKLDQISVPNFIRSLPDRFDRESINEANHILTELGWPVAPEVTAEYNTEPTNISKYVDNIIGGTSIRQGIQRAELHVALELKNLAGLAPEYKRTEQFATLEAELDSIARYFDSEEMIIPDLPLDDIWTMVAEIFENSQLTPFNYILKKWEKKYGLGPFWGVTNPVTGRWRKLSRKNFIRSIGGMANMVRLWATTFEVAPSLPGVAPVSIKSEALPPKKWMSQAVRTIVGAPITHYISSTLWNFWPNHNFKFWSTNIKIGMPLNGACLSRLIKQHSRYDFHFGGDFSQFDSTLQGKILQLIAKVRKKGFERHRDYAKICHLIDANYYGLLNQPLMTTSTGNIYSKKVGLSTGHSSTGMDNSLALTILYLIAWKQLTGLSASEFRHYCKLSNYGDDHILSWLATAPAAWTPYNIMNVMSRMKCTLRDEFPIVSKDGVTKRKTLDDWRSLHNLEFLSKLWRSPNVTDRFDLERLGITVPDFVIFHNPLKLIGKAYAPSKDAKVNFSYRIKRLVGYLSLTAHQPDLYDKLKYDINLLLRRRDGTFMRSPVPVPTYTDVLVKWYNETTHFDEEDVTNFDDRIANPILDYSMDGLADTIVNLLSVIPDILNPAIYNMGYINWIVATFGDRVAWPVELVRRANSASSVGVLSSLGKRTFYDFLFENPRTLAMQVDATDGDLLVRHWLFCLLRTADPLAKPGNLVQWIDKKLAEVNFMVNGYVQPYIRRFDLPIMSMMIIAGLSFINGPKIPSFVTKISIPTVGSLLEFIYGYVLNTLWSSVPANMKQSYAALDTLSEQNPVVLIEAPTGTGKSTTFVNYVWRYFGHRYNRVFLVVPRSLLVTSLTPYLNEAFGLPAFPVTDGHPFNASYRLVVTTPQEVLLHQDWVSDGNLFLVDECHVLEPAVLAIQHVIKHSKVPFVMMTATPTQENLACASTHVPLQIASTWTVIDDNDPSNTILEPVTDEKTYWALYKRKIVDTVRVRTLSRFLIFVANRSHAYELVSRIQRRVCVLTATDRTLDTSAEVFIATSVADVGLTIPDVDWVISSDLTRTKDPDTDELLWIRADPLLLRQRRGRTGRTSNGVFTLIQFRQATFVSPAPSWDDATIGLEVLRSTGAVSTVVTFWPETIAKVLKIEASRLGSSPEVSHFVEAFGTMAEVMKPNEQRTYRTTVDGVTANQFWHISGNRIPTAVTVLTDGEKDALSLSIKQGWDFMIHGAAYLARRSIGITTDSFEAYLRTNYVDDSSFMAYATSPQDVVGMNNPALATEPSGRFGRRGAAAGRKARSQDDDILRLICIDGAPSTMPPAVPVSTTLAPAGNVASVQSPTPTSLKPSTSVASRVKKPNSGLTSETPPPIASTSAVTLDSGPAQSDKPMPQPKLKPALLWSPKPLTAIASGHKIFGNVPVKLEGTVARATGCIPIGWQPLPPEEVKGFEKNAQLYYLRINRLWKAAVAALGRDPTEDDYMP